MGGQGDGWVLPWFGSFQLGIQVLPKRVPVSRRFQKRSGSVLAPICPQNSSYRGFVAQKFDDDDDDDLRHRIRFHLINPCFLSSILTARAPSLLPLVCKECGKGTVLGMAARIDGKPLPLLKCGRAQAGCPEVSKPCG